MGVENPRRPAAHLPDAAHTKKRDISLRLSATSVFDALLAASLTPATGVSTRPALVRNENPTRPRHATGFKFTRISPGRPHSVDPAPGRGLWDLGGSGRGRSALGRVSFRDFERGQLGPQVIITKRMIKAIGAQNEQTGAHCIGLESGFFPNSVSARASGEQLRRGRARRRPRAAPQRRGRARRPANLSAHV